MTTTTTPITPTLRTLHTRVGLGFVYLQTNRANPNLFHQGRTRLESIVVKRYLPALNAMLAEHGRDAIAAQLAHVEGRLGTGATLLGKAQTQRIDDAYIELVHEYEILTDACQVGQHPDTYLNRFFDRVEGIQKQPVERVAIVGSREYPNLDLVREFVNALPLDTVIVSGGARGVDRVAADAARARGMAVVEHLPDDEDGPGRFHVRNRKIVNDSHRVAAFWDGKSRGTSYTFNYGKERNRAVEVYLPDGARL